MDQKVVNFEELNLEGEDNQNKDNKPGLQEKLAAHMKTLRTKLSPEDFAAVSKDLGFKTDLTNEELLEAIKVLLAAPKKEKEGEEETDEDKTKMASYKDFMAKCMKDGKDLKACAEEYKKQYPKATEPSKEEQAEVEALAKKKPEDEYPSPEYKKKMEGFEAQLKTLQGTVTELTAKLTQEKNTSVLAAKVDKLVEEKHLAPSQRDGIIQLAAVMPVAEQEKLLGFFRSTQKLGGLFEESGRQRSEPLKSKELENPDYRKRLTEEFRINEIVEDRGVKNKGGNN